MKKVNKFLRLISKVEEKEKIIFIAYSKIKIGKSSIYLFFRLINTTKIRKSIKITYLYLYLIC